MDGKASRKDPGNTGRAAENVAGPARPGEETGAVAGPRKQAGPSAADRPRSGADLLAQCRVDTFRSGGAGGQHQNKVESGVRLTHLPTGVVVSSRRHRSQHRNRQDALERLETELEARSRTRKPRIPTAVPKRERRKRLEAKKRRSRLKKLRDRPDPGED